MIEEVGEAFLFVLGKLLLVSREGVCEGLGSYSGDILSLMSSFSAPGLTF